MLRSCRVSAPVHTILAHLRDDLKYQDKNLRAETSSPKTPKHIITWSMPELDMEAKNDLLLLGGADRGVVQLATDLGEVEARFDVVRQLNYLRVFVGFQCPWICFPF